MESVSNVFLVGPMGAGKSTIGRLLAGELNLSFKDTDQVIEERTGADIPWIFEDGFRRRETAVLRELVEQRGLVLATGGGIVLRPENRRALQSGGRVIYLTASIEQLLERTYKDRKRPLLQVDDPRSRIIELINLRDPLYREVADLIISTDKRSPRTVAQDIARRLHSRD
ncbi:MAG: shikimate kinase AroK [Exilibacterium sp.]